MAARASKQSRFANMARKLAVLGSGFKSSYQRACALPHMLVLAAPQLRA